MRDPFFLPPIPALSEAVRPWADKLGMTTLPLHIHEVLFAVLLYTFVHVVVSPLLSEYFVPQYYPRHSRGKKANWDSHVVSMVQSTLINGLALWIMFADKERKSMDWEQRIWGYTGAAGMIQALVVGYFLWDFCLTLVFFDVFGPGLLAHAVSALSVYSFGFRPFLNYYGCVFILYELSTMFLNVHWFCDKMELTGSKIQLYNGITLLFTFFGSRLVWGTAQSAKVWWDMWRAVNKGPDPSYVAAALANPTFSDPDLNIMTFATDTAPIPVWLAVIYLASNLVLNGLNWHWFFKMIAAVRKRFEPAKEKDEKADGVANGSASGKASGTEGKPNGLRKRRNTLEETLEDMVPDIEELRDGTIQ